MTASVSNWFKQAAPTENKAANIAGRGVVIAAGLAALESSRNDISEFKRTLQNDDNKLDILWNASKATIKIGVGLGAMYVGVKN